MDSSGVRSQGLKTRDERDQIPMRRKIRGLYSGAGKGDSRRLELNFEREEDGDENIFERTNHATSLRLVSGIINLAKNEWISKDTAHPYPAKYTDEHETRPIFKVVRYLICFHKKPARSQVCEPRSFFPFSIYLM